MTPSVSALSKWTQMFPDRDIRWEFDNARRLGRNTRKKLAEQFPGIRRFHGTFQTLSPCGAVFVLSKGHFLVDVFPLQADGGRDDG